MVSLAVSNGDTFNFYLAINFALCCKEGQEHIGKGFNFNIEKNDSQKEQITEKLKSKHFFFWATTIKKLLMYSRQLEIETFHLTKSQNYNKKREENAKLPSG